MVPAKLRIALLLTLTAVGVGMLANQTRSEQPRTDWYVDPLPPGALARLGSIRLRHVSATVAFSAGGKTLISAGADGMLRFWEPVSGKEIRRVRVQAADASAFPQVFAADAETVAGLTSQDIYVWDSATGKQRKRFPVDKIAIPGLEKRSAQVWRLALSPDGKMVAVQLNDLKDRPLHLWNVNTGKKLFTWKLGKLRDSLAFSSEGKLLGTVSFNAGLQLWDTATGNEVRKIAGAHTSLAFSADGKKVAAVSGVGGVKVWNVADGKECFNVEPAREHYPNFLSFAPDDKTLVINFREDFVLYDVAAGKRLRTIPDYGRNLAFSPDSKIAATSGPAIHLWDLASGKEIAPRPSHRGGVTSLAIAPDGGRAATFETGPFFRVWDSASGRPLLHVSAHKYYVRSGTFSPNGLFLVTGGGEGILRCWDGKTGAEGRTFTIESSDPAPTNVQVMAVALSSDGERLVSVAAGGQLHVWDFATGKRLARRTLRGVGFDTRFSPDLRSMADESAKDVVVSDTATGREIITASGKAPLAYSPDGQILATTLYQRKPQPNTAGGGDGAGLPENAEAIVLTELATGKRLARIDTGQSGFRLLAYSPDGRTLATIGRDSIRLWDAATGREIFRRTLPEEYRSSDYAFVTSLAFFPSSDRLATGLLDGTTLIWDLEPKTWHTGRTVKDLAPRDLERLWAVLAADDAAKAYQAEWTLAAIPVKAVPFLQDHLRPAAALDAKQVQRLIADLDSPEFTVREEASKKLASFGEQAEPALRRALEGKPSLEARKRLQALHTDAEWAERRIVHSAELLRTSRAIRVLEHIGDREARQLLQMLAAGDSAARSTRLAKEALQRLRGRTAGGKTVSPG